VWHWSRETGYPSDETLASWKDEGNIVLLQSEVMLWKDWNLAFVPRLGEEEFARVRNTLHDHGVRFIVYTSPAYFFADTPFEQHAFNSFDGFTNWPPFRGIGDNIDAFMTEIGRVMREYRPDGLYFDGQYVDSAAALYALARRTRDLLGPEGILEWHSTGALGQGMCSLPPADAYVDFILRGEGRDAQYEDPDYLRFFVSGFNVHNSIGVLCNNGPNPTAGLIERLLEVNGRLHTLARWLADPALRDLVHTAYLPRMTPDLRADVLRGVNARQAQVAQQARALADERHLLSLPPAWSKALLVEPFDAVPDWPRAVSKKNARPFTVQEGALAITAKAHTHAYLTQPLGQPSTGVVVKLHQHTGGGMSWGPSVCLRWTNGTVLRMGLRSDGRIQMDYNGEQRLLDSFDPAQWVWLRARWLAHLAVIERSLDGTTFETVHTFGHGGKMAATVEGLSVGKVPYDGQPKDHTEPGPEGACLIDELVVY